MNSEPDEKYKKNSDGSINNTNYEAFINQIGLHSKEDINKYSDIEMPNYKDIPTGSY